MFGEVLRRLRIGARLTQSELAERAGLSARGVQDLERGIRRTPHPDTVRRLATALGLGEADRLVLLGGVQLAPAPPLPLSPNPLIGREAELLAARAHLLDEYVRLLTLTGVGGTGKTRLALEVAEQLRDDFGQQVHALRRPGAVG
jgi:transcriptional regulator with XRE-family HTH domain